MMNADDGLGQPMRVGRPSPAASSKGLHWTGPASAIAALATVAAMFLPWYHAGFSHAFSPPPIRVSALGTGGPAGFPVLQIWRSVVAMIAAFAVIAAAIMPILWRRFAVLGAALVMLGFVASDVLYVASQQPRVRTGYFGHGVISPILLPAFQTGLDIGAWMGLIAAVTSVVFAVAGIWGRGMPLPPVVSAAPRPSPLRPDYNID